MKKMIELSWLCSKITTPSIREITLQVTALINSGEIPAGSLLPPVRQLAKALGIGPSTISAVWRVLRKHRMVTGAGKQGITVIGSNKLPSPGRFSRLNEFGEHIIADLTYAVPDQHLLPDLSQAMASAVQVQDLNSYRRDPIIPALKAAVSPLWPYQPLGLMATNGGFEGLYFTLKALILPGALVAVEDPTALRILDILDSLEASVIAIPCDSEGPDPLKLAEALEKKPQAFIYQPRSHSPCGHSVSQKRFKQLVKVFKSRKTLIIEDDGLGDLSTQPIRSLGQYYPQQTIYIRSYSKAYGPDLRLAVLSASNEVIQQIQDYRDFSAGWSSRLLQQALVWLIQDPQTQQQIDDAKKVYAARYNMLIEALKKRGVKLPRGQGLFLWLPVPSEQFALITMAAKGFSIVPSRNSSVNITNHIRIATSLLSKEVVDLVAEAIVLALKPPKVFRQWASRS